MKPGIRHLENHLRKQAWEDSGGLHSLSSLSGKQFQPSQHTHYTSSQTQVSNRRAETKPVDGKKEGRNWENRTNETRQTKTRRQVTAAAVPEAEVTNWNPQRILKYFGKQL